MFESAKFQIDMVVKRDQNRSENGQPMGNTSQKKKAKVEVEDKIKLGTVAPAIRRSVR